MKGTLVHGILLVVMLAFAYQTWTRDTSTKQSTGSIVLWDEKPGDLQKIVEESSDRTITIERKTDNGGYWWGSEAKITKKPKKSDASPLADGGVPPVEYDTTTTTVEFPIDPAPMSIMVPGFSAMRAVNDLGVLSDDLKEQYKLKDADKTLTLVFGGKNHSFAVGDHVINSDDRYVLDVATDHGYILAGTLIEPLETGQQSLQPKQLIPLDDTIGKVDIATPDGKTKSVSRITVTDEQSNKQIKTWGDPAKNVADQTTANFLTKVASNVHPTKYDATLDPSTMTKLATLTYHDPSGKVLTTLDLYKKSTPAPEPPPPPPGQAPPPTPPPATDYYIVTETTRVPALIARTAGDQIEQNIPGVFTE